MVVETQSVQFDNIALDSGATLSPVEIAYETWGTLDADGGNAVPRCLVSRIHQDCRHPPRDADCVPDVDSAPNRHAALTPNDRHSRDRD